MPTQTGAWTDEESTLYHDYSYRLMQWIGTFLPKDKPIIDFGSGLGTYLRYLHDMGFKDLRGVEAIIPSTAEFGRMQQQDLTEPFVIDKIGNSICLEVGEHIPEEHLEIFIDNISTNTADKLILSWAIPGQDGVGHLSCRHNVWVIDKLQDKGFTFLPKPTLDVRSRIEERVQYFRNTLLIFQKNQ